ncbi:agmatinase, mitochondrial-like [Clavelina lepadiformis]|uniref:agmatinase, mitochondrial-like n=1 Tax=Clavelina lepadiformis TaxID=159417 RepID=UPI00404316C5
MFQPVKRKACGAKKINQPLTGNDFPLPAGFPSFMKLPIATSTEGLDACFVGVPMDNGTGYKPGARFAPREMRAESAIIRPCNPDTGAQPFTSLSVADIGDVPVNLFNVAKSCENIRESFNKIVKDGCVPLVMGGDHTITYPILQALGKKYGPLGVIYIDAHSDCAVSVAGERLTHSTSLRRAIEENFVDCKRVVQIGQRGTRVNVDPYQYEKDLGFRMIPAVDCWYKSLAPLMVEIREQMGTGPVYMSFCIDALDPAYAPGTGFPEIGGLTTIQAMEIIRGCKGLNMVGFEMDEVTPVYDSSGVTSATAGKLLYEMLCVVPSVKYAEK